MASLLSNSADDLLGAGQVGPSLFSADSFSRGDSITSRYRVARSRFEAQMGLSQAAAKAVQDNVTMIDAIRTQEAMRNEATVLDRLKELDPIDADFEQKALAFTPMATYSKAVGTALDLKMRQREQADRVLSTVSTVLGEAGVDPGVAASVTTEAAELLRRRNLPGLGDLLFRSSKLASDKIRRDAEVLRKEERDLQEKDRAEDRKIRAQERADYLEDRKAARDADIAKANFDAQEEALKPIREARAKMVESHPDLVQNFPGFFDAGDVEQGHEVQVAAIRSAVDAAAEAGNAGLAKLAAAAGDDDLITRIMESASGTKAAFVAQWYDPTKSAALPVGEDVLSETGSTATIDKNVLEDLYDTLRDVRSYAIKVKGAPKAAAGGQTTAISVEEVLQKYIEFTESQKS